MGISELTQRPPVIPRDLLELLGSSGVRALLELMRDAYNELVSIRGDFSGMSENDITEEWYVQLVALWRSSKVPSSIVPIHEKQDKTKAAKRGRPPTIDFCFRGSWDTRAYFGAEAKLVEADDKKLCDEYVSAGVERYVSGKYNPVVAEGAMLAYIRRSRCADVAEAVKQRVVDLPGSPIFQKETTLLPFEDYYTSNHVKNTRPFLVHHLLFNLPIVATPRSAS